MENSLNAIGLKEISYPVFKLGLNKPTTENGVVFYLQYRYDEEDNEIVQLKVVDDKNKPQQTLSLRRLQLQIEGVDLFKIHTALYFLGDLIKLATPQTWFVDNNGKVFNYLKTEVAKLKIYPVTKLLPVKGGGVIVEVKGIMTRFKALFMPLPEMEFAGILHWKQSLILYGFYETQHNDSWRKI